MELQVIDQREVLNKDFKIYGDLENPLFLAKDVAEWIEHSSITMMLKSIDEDEKLKIRPKQSLGLLTNNNEYWFLTEDGLYEVLMQSRKPIAKKFKKEVKAILKDIRKKGVYMTDNKAYQITHNPDALADLLLQAGEQLKQKELTIKEMKPKADYYDKILNNESLVTVSTIAKNYGMSAKKFNQLLHDLGVQYRQSGTWLLYSKYQDEGYTHVAPFGYTDKNGAIKIRQRMKWTQKGHIFIYELLKKNDIFPAIEKLWEEN